MELGNASVLPAYARVINERGVQLAVSTPAAPLDPASGAVGLCGSRTMSARRWTIMRVPSDVIDALREGTPIYRFEVMVDGQWRPALMVDSGCRTTGSG